MISMIVAANELGVIGDKGGIPWHLPDDLKHFRKHTVGKAVILGRKTYDGLKGPLPWRTNIVLTTRPDIDADGVFCAESVQHALAIAEKRKLEVVVAGGLSVYREMLPYVSRVIYTEVHNQVNGDTCIAVLFKDTEWIDVSMERRFDSKRNNTHTFWTYERV